MRFAVPIMKVLKVGGVTVATKLAGLLLAAIAVQMIAEAIAQFVRDYV
jgi:multiple antibiotic resistance protein